MQRVTEREQVFAGVACQLIVERQNAGQGRFIRAFDLSFEIVIVITRNSLVDHQQKVGDIQAARYVYRHGCALKILVIGAQDDDQQVRNSNGEQGFFVQAGMGVDKETVQLE